MGNRMSRDVQGDGQCPVHRRHADQARGCPVQHEASGGCPVRHEDASTLQGSACSSNEETAPAELLDDEEAAALGATREASTIPRGDKAATWEYPSERQFLAALRRKGEDDDVETKDVASIVAIHNEMNERAWRQIEEFEGLCHPESEPRLLSFRGRPKDLTPLAWMKKMLGQGAPFDRHDWVVVREDGEEVRYVIDYYYEEGPTSESKQENPESTEGDHSHQPITMYARPAVDSVQSLVDRVKYPVLSRRHRRRMHRFVHEDAEVSLTAAEVEKAATEIQTTCATRLTAVQTCENTVECTGAATALQLCLAGVVCPARAQDFRTALEHGDEDEVEKAFEAMNAGIEQFQRQSTKVLRENTAQKAMPGSSAAQVNVQ